MRPSGGRDRVTVRFSEGEVRLSAVQGDLTEVGDRLVPSRIEVAIVSAADAEPVFSGLIEVVGGIPRWTDIRLTSEPSGREIREKDLRGIALEDWIEDFVAHFARRNLPSDRVVYFSSGKRESGRPYGEQRAWQQMREGRSEIPTTPDQLSSAASWVREKRSGTRRAMTPDRLNRVATTYNAQTTHGLEAVERAFGVSRATAALYVKQAREAGLIEDRRRGKQR